MHGCPFGLGPYLGGEGMYQKSENMWSFQMTPSNYRYVTFMWAKCIHRETAGQPRNQRLPYKLADQETIDNTTLKREQFLNVLPG